jgi:hypothetical protein
MQSVETRAKMSAAQKSKIIPSEQRAKMRDGLLRYYETLRQEASQ